MGKETVGYDVLGGTSSLCFDQCAKIASRKATFIGKPGYRRKAFTLGVIIDVVIEQGDELLHHIVVYLLTREELTVVEAQAVVEQ